MKPWSWRERKTERRRKKRRGQQKKDGNNDIRHWLINEESRDVRLRLQRLQLMSINSKII